MKQNVDIAMADCDLRMVAHVKLGEAAGRFLVGNIRA